MFCFLFPQMQAAGDVDLTSYGHLPVDRFAVLLDLWTNEADFLENKRQVNRALLCILVCWGDGGRVGGMVGGLGGGILLSAVCYVSVVISLPTTVS